MTRLPAHRQFAGDVRGERGLAHAAFLIEQGNDHGAALPAGKPAVSCLVKPSSVLPRFLRAFCLSAVVHRNGAPLLKVRVFEVREVKGAPKPAPVMGFAAVSHA